MGYRTAVGGAGLLLEFDFELRWRCTQIHFRMSTLAGFCRPSLGLYRRNRRRQQLAASFESLGRSLMRSGRNPVNEMVRRSIFHRAVEDRVGRFKEDHRHADSFRWYRSWQDDLSPRSAERSGQGAVAEEVHAEATDHVYSQHAVLTDWYGGCAGLTSSAACPSRRPQPNSIRKNTQRNSSWPGGPALHPKAEYICADRSIALCFSLAVARRAIHFGSFVFSTRV